VVLPNRDASDCLAPSLTTVNPGQSLIRSFETSSAHPQGAELHRRKGESCIFSCCMVHCHGRKQRTMYVFCVHVLFLLYVVTVPVLYFSTVATAMHYVCVLGSCSFWSHIVTVPVLQYCNNSVALCSATFMQNHHCTKQLSLSWPPDNLGAFVY
jgi:hypothetical protein